MFHTLWFAAEERNAWPPISTENCKRKAKDEGVDENLFSSQQSQDSFMPHLEGYQG